MDASGPSTTTDTHLNTSYMKVPEKIQKTLTSNTKVSSQFCFVGEVLSGKLVRNIIVLKALWAKFKKSRIVELLNVVMIFEFRNERDITTIMDMDPRLIQERCLSLKL